MYTPNGKCCELSIPNIFPKLSTRETGEDAETSEEDRAYYSSPVRLFASKQEAGGRSCLFPCRCRSCFRELPLTSTPGVSSPLWLCAPTPVRSFFPSPCYTSSMSVRLGHADPPHLARCRCTCSGELCRRTHPLTHTHTHSSVFLCRLKQSPLHLRGGCSNKKKALLSALESPD